MLIENTLVGYVVVSDDIVPGQRVYVTTECSEHKNRSRFSYGRIKPIWESPFDGFPYLSIHYWTDKELTMEIYGTQRALPEGLPIFLDRFNANVLASDLRDVNASYPDPDCNSPLWYYSDFISLVYKNMNTSPCPRAEQAIREAIDFDDSMAWFFQQKPERIAQLAFEMGDPCDPDDEPDLAWAGSTI